MVNILNEILKDIPEGKISASCFEGANIVLYTKDRDFFLNNEGIIKSIVDKIKKRIELRPDPAITFGMEKAEDIIKRIIPEEAGLSKIIFDPQRSIVIIEVEKPGLAIGRSGEVLNDIKRQISWVPLVRRTPAMGSKIIENIRQVLYENNDYRKKFLNNVGKRIYDGWFREKKHEWIRVSFLGAGRQVGRSCLFLQTPESRVLLDCGIDVAASDQESFPYLDSPEFDINELDAVIITHPHIDHSGLVPFLFKMGYKGPVYWTEPCRDISSLLALDLIAVAFKQAKKAIYTATDIKEMVKHTICLEYGEVNDITPDLRLTFFPAGHTLGSAIVHLNIGNGLHNLLYTGDFKLLKTRLLEGVTTKFSRVETVIMESTYGGKENVLPNRFECEEYMIDLIKKTISRGCKVLMPVLGVGRAQEDMLIIENAIETGKLEKVPVYVQGLVWDVTAMHTAYPDFLNSYVRKLIFHKDQNPFLSKIFKQIASSKEKQEVIEGGPCIIMATSGMMQGGASVEYFKNLADDPRHSIIFTCYQSAGTLGRLVQIGEKEIIMPGEKDITKVNMEVYTIDGLSGHAGRTELLKFIYYLEPKPKKIIVCHGESSRCLDLASSLHKLNRIESVAPRNLDCLRLK